MIRTAIGVLALVSVVVLSGCSEQPDDGGQVAAQSVSPPHSSDPPGTPYSAPGAVCGLVGAAASALVAGTALAIASGKEGPALRAQVATAYNDFARSLAGLAVREIPANLRLALVAWGSASTDVARFVAENEPGPGLVIDYGPAHSRWSAAKRDAEQACGHELPRTG